MVDGLLLTNKKEPPFCEGCVFGKAKKTPFPNKNVKVRGTKIAKIVHTNLCSPFNILSMGGTNYYIIFKGDHSSYKILYNIAKKLEALTCFKKYVKLMKRRIG